MIKMNIVFGDIAGTPSVEEFIRNTRVNSQEELEKKYSEQIKEKGFTVKYREFKTREELKAYEKGVRETNFKELEREENIEKRILFLERHRSKNQKEIRKEAEEDIENIRLEIKKYKNENLQDLYFKGIRDALGHTYFFYQA